MTGPEKANLPWVEKYRPQSLDDLISHEEIMSTLNRFLTAGILPHLLFYGPPGTGKTSTVLACARRLYPANLIKSMVLELNASDDRGIGVVRGPILNFASSRTCIPGKFKLLLLDEADAMTNDAQNALRRILEKYTENVRFCMVCNYLSKIIPALQSRCTRFRFGPLNTEQVAPRIREIALQENVVLSEDGLQALLSLCGGDMRRAVNALQAATMSSADGTITEEGVYLCLGQPMPKEVEMVASWALSENMVDAQTKIRRLQSSRGLALQDLLTALHRLIMRLELPVKAHIHLLDKLALIEEHLAAGSSDKLQLSALVAAFVQAKSIAGDPANLREVIS